MTLREQFWPLLGNWTGTEEQAASPWSPAATTRAMHVFRLDLADTAVVQDYRQVRADGGEFTGHGIFQADPEDGTIRWWFFDAYAQPPAVAVGEWTDQTLTLHRTSPRGQAWHYFRVEGDPADEYAAVELEVRIDLQLAGQSEQTRFLTGRYRRVSGH